MKWNKKNCVSYLICNRFDRITLNLSIWWYNKKKCGQFSDFFFHRKFTAREI